MIGVSIEAGIGVLILAVELSLFLLLLMEDARVLILVVFASIAAGIVDVITDGCSWFMFEDEVVLVDRELTPLKNTV
jgi:hypothetical protein